MNCVFWNKNEIPWIQLDIFVRIPRFQRCNSAVFYGTPCLKIVF